MDFTINQTYNRRNMKSNTLTLLLFGLLACSEKTSLPKLEFIDDFTLPDEVSNFSDTRIGGLSALYFEESSGLLYALSDDPADPNIKGRESSRYYTFKLSLDEKGLSVAPNSVVILKEQGAPLAPGSVDPEAWVRTSTGFLISSEGQPARVAKHKRGEESDPSVPEWFEIDMNGEITHRYALDERFVATDWSEKKGTSPAQGIEALFVQSEHYISLTEGPLYQDKELFPNHLQLSFYNQLANPLQPERGLTYLSEPFPSAEILGFEPVIQENGVSDAVGLSKQAFLTIERGYYTDKKEKTRNIIKIYQVQWDSTTTKKRLVLDLDKIIPRLKLPPHLVNHPLDNIEGMTWGPKLNGKQTLLLVSDDNFNAKQRTLFLAFLVE